MDRTDRNEKNDTQRTKLIFLLLEVTVAVLLIWSFVASSKARSERNMAKQELEMVRQDNAKLEQMVKDLSQENEALKKKTQQQPPPLREDNGRNGKALFSCNLFNLLKRMEFF
jgi:regulatory protein YycI of two-component signal transduction system YycFG